MEKIKFIWKYQKIALLVLMSFSVLSLFLSQNLIKDTVATNISNIKLIDFLENHSQFESRILIDLVVKSVFIKDCIIILITIILLLFFFVVHRRILRDRFGMVKIGFVVIFFICLYGLLMLDYIVMKHLHMLNTALVIKYIIQFIILSIMLSIFIWFIVKYIQYRKENDIKFFTRASILNLANKMIRHFLTLVFVVLLVTGVGVLLLSKSVQYVISRLEIEKIIGNQIQINITEIFAVLPDFLGKLIQRGPQIVHPLVVVVDVKKIGDQLQTLLMACVQNYTQNMMLLMIKTFGFYLLVESLNEVHQYRKFMIDYITYILVLLVSMRVVFFTSSVLFFQIVDVFLFVAVLLYGGVLVEWEKHFIQIKRKIMKIK